MTAKSKEDTGAMEELTSSLQQAQSSGKNKENSLGKGDDSRRRDRKGRHGSSNPRRSDANLKQASQTSKPTFDFNSRKNSRPPAPNTKKQPMDDPRGEDPNQRIT